MQAREQAKRIRGFQLLLVVVIGLVGHALGQKLTVLTHDSFALSEAVVKEFTDETGVEVEFLPAGDAGAVVNRAILTKARPLADVLYGIDNSLLARALNEDIFEPYQSPALENVSPRYRFDPQGYVTPVDVGFVNFNLDKAFFEERGLELPSTLEDLTDPAYKGLTVVANPATSSPGLAFMLATIDHFGTEGDDTWLEYWADLRDNGLQVSSGWEDAYYTAFSRYGGDRPVVLSYASSPAAEVMFADTPLSDAPTANLFCEACVYQQIEAVGILKGTKNRAAAEKFIDFMLSEAVQADIPANMFVYPVVTGTPLPTEFVTYGQVPSPEEIAEVASDDLEANLKTWLEQWTAVVEQGRAPEAVR
ncbi:thiamine ABC transporter substrate-binding protein [soil metagenome]